MSLDGEIAWFERYIEAGPADQRRALYGRTVFDLVKFIKEHGSEYTSEYEDIYKLRDAASQHLRALLEATIGLVPTSAARAE